MAIDTLGQHFAIFFCIHRLIIKQYKNKKIIYHVIVYSVFFFNNACGHLWRQYMPDNVVSLKQLNAVTSTRETSAIPRLEHGLILPCCGEVQAFLEYILQSIPHVLNRVNVWAFRWPRHRLDVVSPQVLHSVPGGMGRALSCINRVL